MVMHVGMSVDVG